MASEYPGAIDGAATTHADVEDAVLAVQTELGLNPSGSAATVAARLTALDSTVAGKAAAADLTAETTARTDADSALDGRLDTVEAALPGKADDADVTAAIDAHEAAANPHPIYLTQAEADALYSGGGGGADTRLVSGTATGQFAVWDATDGRYEPMTVSDATAADVPFAPDGTVAATTVQAAVVEVATDAATALTAHIDDASAAHAASAIAFTPTGAIAATNVQDAIAEAAAEAGGGGGGGGNALAVYKPANETVNNSATLQNDDHLFWSVNSGEVWTGLLFASCSADNATPDFKFKLTEPGGSTSAQLALMSHSARGDGLSLSGSGGFQSAELQVLGDSVVQRVVVIGVRLTATATGTARIQWAQAAASASNSTVHAGSYLMLMRG